jgi:hypothetical protein
MPSIWSNFNAVFSIPTKSTILPLHLQLLRWNSVRSKRCPGSSFSATSRSLRQFLNCLAAIQGIMRLYCTRIPQDFHRRPRFIRFPSPLYASPKPLCSSCAVSVRVRKAFLASPFHPPLNNVNPGLSLLGGYPHN